MEARTTQAAGVRYDVMFRSVYKQKPNGVQQPSRAPSGGVAAQGAMLQVRSFWKKTSKGRLLKVRSRVWLRAVWPALSLRAQVVKEHYLRDDIYCGSPVAAPEHRGARLRLAAHEGRGG